MSEEVRVGTRCITFHVTVLEPPIDIAEVRVDVPIYVTTGETIGYNDMSYRRRPASEILWAMVKANGKRTN